MTRVNLLMILTLCLMVAGCLSCTRRQASVLIDLRGAPEGPPGPIATSPRYASYCKDEFILTVFNKLANRILVMMVGEKPIIIEAGQRADIPFKKEYDCRKVILTANVLSRGGKLVGTAEKKEWIPSRRRHSRTADIWAIDSYYPLRY